MIDSPHPTRQRCPIFQHRMTYKRFNIDPGGGGQFQDGPEVLQLFWPGLLVLGY